MEKQKRNFGEMKQKNDTYVEEAKKAAIIVNDSVDSGSFSDLSIKLDDLPSVGIIREKYVFSRQKSIIPVLLMILSIIMLLIFGYELSISVGTLAYSKKFEGYAIVGIIISIIFMAFNIFIIGSVLRYIKYGERYDKYKNILRFHSIEIIDDLAAYAQIPSAKVIRDLQVAVKKKLIPQGHFGKDDIIFIVSNDTYNRYKEKQAIYDRYFRKQVEERLRMKERSKEMENILSKGQQYVAKIHESNDIIKDKVISKKLDRMEKVVSMIFHEVDINPKQADKLGMFMNYYLPTTEKLLEAYIEIDEKQIKGKTLEKTKKDIESALDKIIDSFEGLLDKFYQEQDLDISSDISAMEIIMKQEGLTE